MSGVGVGLVEVGLKSPPARFLFNNIQYPKFTTQIFPIRQQNLPLLETQLHGLVVRHTHQLQEGRGRCVEEAGGRGESFRIRAATVVIVWRPSRGLG